VVGDDGRVWRADAVVVAAGVWSAPLLRGVGLTAPLIAERGYHIGFQNADWPQDLSPVVFDDRAMVVTRFAHGMRATSFVEFGRPHSPPDPSKWRRLEAHARAVGVLRDGPVSRWMGSRPTLPDYLPAIGGGERPGVFYAVGHSHLGLTLAALTGELMRDRLLGRPPGIDLTPLSLERFGRVRPR
jgi:D-hydroxyproline dehydrogenase